MMLTTNQNSSSKTVNRRFPNQKERKLNWFKFIQQEAWEQRQLQHTYRFVNNTDTILTLLRIQNITF